MQIINHQPYQHLTLHVSTEEAEKPNITSCYNPQKNEKETSSKEFPTPTSSFLSDALELMTRKHTETPSAMHVLNIYLTIKSYLISLPIILSLKLFAGMSDRILY